MHTDDEMGSTRLDEQLTTCNTLRVKGTASKSAKDQRSWTSVMHDICR